MVLNRKYLKTKQKSMEWLKNISRGMQKHNQTLFYIERIQPSWLPSKKLQRYYQPFRAEEKYTSDQDTANALKTSFR